jgi:histidine triad (HIT) family protein
VTAEGGTVAYDRGNVFARILRDEIPSDRVFEDDEFVAFRDVAPQAPAHIVLIPRGEPPASPAELRDADAAWVGRMVVRAARIAAAEGLDRDGYRLVMNCGDYAGQTVRHLHLHILGGRPLGGLG